MSLFSKDIRTMDDLFVRMLGDIYYTEQEVLKALPAMTEKATNPELRSGFERHRVETFQHFRRVEQVFKMHGVEPETINSSAIDGIIKEAEAIAGKVDNKEVLDAALIAAAQAVEHYEITRYGALISWAKQLGRSDCANVLHRNLEEEKAADQKLTQIAESRVNLAAAQ
ncbi:MAG: YciE/YciF ferroxidase family protein [Beijerinckiaceae bacterium]